MKSYKYDEGTLTTKEPSYLEQAIGDRLYYSRKYEFPKNNLFILDPNKLTNFPSCCARVALTCFALGSLINWVGSAIVAGAVYCLGNKFFEGIVGRSVVVHPGKNINEVSEQADKALTTNPYPKNAQDLVDKMKGDLIPGKKWRQQESQHRETRDRGLFGVVEL